MTAIMPANSPRGDEEELPTVIVSNSSSQKANDEEFNGESGDGERPVREKLKKTSIAHMANGTTPPTAVDGEIEDQPRTLAADRKEDTLMEDEVDLPGKPSRPLSKRPLPEAEESGTLSPDMTDIATNGHARKKSKDERPSEAVEVVEVHSDSSSKSMDAEQQIVQDAPPKHSEDAPSPKKVETKIATVTPPITESVDEEMKEQLSSPRKKRSRDQFEPESHERGQKVAATEETRSRRRSMELKRSRSPEESGDISDSRGTDLESTREEPAVDKTSDIESKVQSSPVYIYSLELTRLAQSPTDLASNDTVAAPSGAIARDPSPSKDTPSDRTFGQATQTSSNAFAASGFAALANTSTSPFGTLASSKPQQDSSTKPPLDSKISSSQPSNAAPTTKTSDSKQRVFGSATPIVPLAKENGKPNAFGPPLTSFASSQPSGGFGSLGQSGFGSLTSTQGSAFSSSPFGAGPKKLSTFAAPTGDAKLGSSTTASAFGAPAETEDSEEGSDVGSDEDEEKRGDEKKEKKDRDGAADPRFHKQESKSSHYSMSRPKLLLNTDTNSAARDGEDAEDNIFMTPRGKLFAFTDGRWKERGTGTFKLNVLHPSAEAKEDNQKPTARFIMRAQLTHRLILNMPLFREMDFTEPQGGKLTFSAMQDGALVGHVLRVCSAIHCPHMDVERPWLTFNRSKKKKREHFTGS